MAVSSANLGVHSLDGAAGSISRAFGQLPFSDSLSRVDKAGSYVTIFIVFVVVQTGSGSLFTAEAEFRSQVNLCRTQLHSNRFCSVYFGCRLSAVIRQFRFHFCHPGNESGPMGGRISERCSFLPPRELIKSMKCEKVQRICLISITGGRCNLLTE